MTLPILQKICYNGCMRLAEQSGDVQETHDIENRGLPLLKAFKGAILAPKSPETDECR